MAIENEKKGMISQGETDEKPQVYSVKKDLQGWKFSRRDFLAAATAAAATAALGSAAGRLSKARAAPVEVLEDPSDAALLNLVPGQRFTKTWRLKNTGQVPWGEQIELRLVDAGQMQAPELLPLPNAAPGEVVTVEMDIVAPTRPGTYQSQWVLNLSNAARHVIYLPIIARPRRTPTPIASPTPSCLAESAHPYKPHADWTWTIVNPNPNARGSRVHFRRIELASGTRIFVKDGSGVDYETIYSYSPSEKWSKPVPGRTVKIRLYSYRSSTAWGFCVDKIESAAPPPTPTPTRTPCSCDTVICTCDLVHYWYPN